MGLTTSSETTATTVPEWYTKYQQDLAAKGAAGLASAQFVGPTDLQNAAFGAAARNVGNYQPGLDAATSTAGRAAGVDITGAAQPFLTAGTQTSGLDAAGNYLTQGSTGADQIVGNYMNPYTQNVVDQIRAANQQNIAQNLSPGLTSGAVGAGQFGSQRGANALAMGVSNANIGALGEQAKALQSGYASALAAAQAQRVNQLNAGQTAGTLQNVANANQIQAGQIASNAASQQGTLYTNAAKLQADLANQQQTQALTDVNTQATMGAQQQTIEQNRQNFGLDTASKAAAIMNNAVIPQTTTKTATGSTLSAIAGLGTLAAGLFTKNASGTAPWDNMSAAMKNAYKGIFGNGAELPGGVTFTGTGPTGFMRGGLPVDMNSYDPTAEIPTYGSITEGGNGGGEDNSNDTITGGSGNDTVDGGNDSVTGGNNDDGLD
jgi:hypothetical protein